MEMRPEFRLTQLVVLPHVGLHAYAKVRMLLQICQPELHGFRVAVPDLDQAAPRDTLEVLLRLLENEIGPGHRPALGNLGQRDRPESWEV